MEDRTVDTAGANVFVGAIDADVEVIVMRRIDREGRGLALPNWGRVGD